VASLSFNWRSLRFKIVASSVLVEIVMLSILVWNSTRIAEQRLIIQTEHRLEELLPLLRAAIKQPLLADDTATLEELVNNIIRKKGIGYAALYDRNERQIYEAGHSHTDQSKVYQENLFKHIQEQGWLVPFRINVVVHAGDSYYLGKLEMEFSTEFIQQSSQAIRDQGLFIAGIEVTISIVLLTLLGFAITQKLYVLRSAAQKMSKGDLSIRAQIPGHDEVSATADAFNKMASAIDQKTRDIKLAIAEQRNSEEYLRAIVENAADAIITTDQAGLICSFNTAAVNLFGYEIAEISGKNVSVLMPEPDRSEHDHYLKNYLQTGKTRIIGRGREVQGLRKDGSLFFGWLSVSRVDALGKISFTGIIHDLTAQKETQQQLRTAKQAAERDRNQAELAKNEAEKANNAKSAFLSSMSHELRTPLNAVIGFSQLLEIDEITESQQLYVQQILKAGLHLLDLITEVLDLVRIESNQLNLSLESVEVQPIIEECLSITETMAAKCNISVKHTVPKGIVIHADRIRFKQTILNLLSNAIKYNRDDGSVCLTTDICADDRVGIQVIDTGPGIPAEKLNDLFVPFNRLGAEGGRIEGTGIGLTITKRILDQMDGTIQVNSELGAGTTFRVELPLVSHVAVNDTQVIAQPKTARESMLMLDSDRKHQILYIEDNPANLMLVVEIFKENKDVALFSAHTAELGIELALSRHPDLILLDINLPGMNGFEALKQMKQTPSLKDVPVIAITANAMVHEIQMATSTGFSDYLVKPLNIVLFMKTVKHYLSRQYHEDATLH